MNPVLAHLALNHLPILGAVFGLGLLAFALATKRNETLRVGLFFLVLTAVAAWPVSLSGESAEEVVEESAEVSHDVIHDHEEAAERAAWAAYAVGVVALVGLVAFRTRPMPGWFKGLSLLGAAAVSGLMLQTAGLGGKIAHEELRDDVPAAEERMGDDVEGEEAEEAGEGAEEG
jgi:hypothetical protein